MKKYDKSQKGNVYILTVPNEWSKRNKCLKNPALNE